MKIAGGNTAARMNGIGKLEGKSNYLTSNDPTKWRTNISTYSKVRCEQVYEGIDLIYYGSGRGLEYDFIVAPGADFRAIALAFDGAESVELDAAGDLVLHTEGGEIRQSRPAIYQEADGVRREVRGGYVLREIERLKTENSKLKTFCVGFEVGEYDASKPLIIDPVLSYSSFLGGSSSDSGVGIAVDSTGNIYVAGTTFSVNFPTTPRAFQRVIGDMGLSFTPDVFIAKLNAAGSTLLYSTYLGGSRFESVRGLAVDEGGNAYLAGATTSSDFPVTPGAFQAALKSGSDAFITKLAPSGDALVYSTYLGGTRTEGASGIAIDTAGNAYVTGGTDSRDFPTANPLQPAHSPDLCIEEDFGFECSDAFVTKLSPDGSSLVYSTYLGGNRSDGGRAIAVDAEGSAYITGETGSSNFPITLNAFQRSFNGGSFANVGDAFVSKLNPSGSALAYSTYLGGRNTDVGASIAVDSSGNAYVLGTTESINFPTTEGSLQPSNAGSAAYRSSNSGSDWSAVKKGLEAISISVMAIDPRSPSTIYAASNVATSLGDSPAKIFKSTDSGASWMRLVIDSVGSINALAVDPKHSNIVYAGTGAGVYKTTDGGGLWLRTGGPLPGTVNAIVIDPKNTDRIYIATGNFLPPVIIGGGVFKSTNGGNRWKPTKLNEMISGQPPFPPAIALSLAIDPKDTSKLYAGTTRGVFRGFNRGKKWKDTSLGASVSALVVDPLDGSIVYAASDTVLRSDDSGRSWKVLIAGAPDPKIVTLAIDPKTPSTLYAGSQNIIADFPNGGVLRTVGGVTKTTDGGSTWSLMELGDVLINALVVDPKDTSNVYAGASADTDAFITAINAAGSALIYSTYLGGRGRDEAFGIAVDSSGRVYLTGETLSPDFPVKDAFQSAKDGGPFETDAFVTVLNATGASLVYSSYLGGATRDSALAIAIDQSGAAYVTGKTASINFPRINGLQPSHGGGNSDAFIVKISPPDS